MSKLTVVLGTPVNPDPRPWEYMDVEGVIVSAFDIAKHRDPGIFRGSGLRRQLGVGDDVEVWIDSGGYQWLLRGIDVGVKKLSKLYQEIDADYYVSLDYPPKPMASTRERAFHIARTVNTYLRMRSTLRRYVEEERLIPVVHMSTGIGLRIQLNVYWNTSSIVSVGGLIPFIMQKAGADSRLKAVLFLTLVRKLWRGHVHALGIASPAILPLINIIGVNSSDTQTWRHKAAYGKIVIPGLGERHITQKSVGFGPAKLQPGEREVLEELLERFHRETGVRLTMDQLRRDFRARALFNAYIVLLVAKSMHAYNGLNPAFSNLYRRAREYAKMPAEDVEQDLERILAASEERVQVEAIQRTRELVGKPGEAAAVEVRG